MAVSFRMAPGRILGPGECTRELVQEWGRIVGMIHRLTKEYPDPDAEIRREHWYEFDYLNVRKYLPGTEAAIVEKADELVARLKELPVDLDSYGLVHTDAHQDNLLVDGNRITLVDFDDAHHMWFAGDIATILFYNRTRGLAGRDADVTEFTRFFLTHFWEGYNRENRLDNWWKETYHDFLQLRQIVIYVWMNKKWDMDNLHESQRAGLDRRRYEIENEVPLIDLDFAPIGA